MQCSRIAELRMKEVINLCDGCRLGYIGDIEVDISCGRVCSIIVPGPCFFWGLFGRGEEYIIPWEAIEKVGDDIVLVRWDAPHPRREKEKRRFFHT